MTVATWLFTLFIPAVPYNADGIDLWMPVWFAYGLVLNNPVPTDWIVIGAHIALTAVVGVVLARRRSAD